MFINILSAFNFARNHQRIIISKMSEMKRSKKTRLRNAVLALKCDVMSASFIFTKQNYSYLKQIFNKRS